MAATTAKPVKSAGKIPGSTLKIIAMVCMLIDHTAAVLFDRILISRGLLDAVNASDGGASFLSTGNTAVIYYSNSSEPLKRNSIGNIGPTAARTASST